MDKEEYKVRLETIRSLAQEGDFGAASQVADTVDWKRVKSIRTLCMIGEVYEASGKFEDANRVLTYAHARQAANKTVLYRLTEVNLRTGHFDDAQRYCDEFEIAARGDAMRHILRYKLLTAKNAPIEERIRVLEAYRESEFTERWAYELAVLYKEHGDTEKCVHLCDDMILWFSEGKYVTKAMELKMKLRPLTAEQLRKYHNRPMDEEEEKDVSPYQSYGFTQEVPVQTPVFTGLAGTNASPAGQKAAAADDGLREGKDPAMQKSLAEGIRAVFAGLRQEEGTDVPEEKDAFAPVTAEEVNPRKIKALEPEMIGSAAITPPLSEGSGAGEKQLTIDQYMNTPEGEKAATYDELMAETRANLANAVASGRYEKLKAEAIEDKPAKEASVTITDLPEEEEAGPKEDPYARLYGKETDETLGLTRPFNLQEEVEKALAAQSREMSESDEALRRRAVEETLRSAGILTDSAREAEAKKAAEAAARAEEDSRMSKEEEEALAAAGFTFTETPVTGGSAFAAAPERSEEEEIEELIGGREKIREMQRRPVEPRPLDDSEKEIFTYFTKVPGMTEQITMALADVHNHADDPTSRSGNIMIIGRQGSGKTRLSDALIVSICKDLGLRAARAAKIIAADLNEKSPAQIFSKLRGGFLVIEGAGEMSDETVGKLIAAMEHRTDNLVVMLEDEKADLMALLSRHPELEPKFTSTIVIPVFTNDELITFARTYAKERGYRVDEMGILALYTKIGNNQSATEPVTVGKVKEMMDAAIGRADSGARRISRRFSKRAVDKDGRILLHEKDFEM